MATIEGARVCRVGTGEIKVTLVDGVTSGVYLLDDATAASLVDDIKAQLPGMDMKAPCGVVAVMVDAKGDIMASASDFERQSYGGYTLREAQEFRVKHQLADAVVRAYCSDVITPGIESHDRYKVIDNLIRKGGCKRIIIPIGWPADER